MINFEIARLIHSAIPFAVAFLTVILSILLGIWISGRFWKSRIARYADAENQKIMIEQAIEIKQLVNEVIDKNEQISNLRGWLKIGRKSAMRFIDNTAEE